MRKLLLLLFLFAGSAQAGIGDCFGSGVVPFKNSPWISVWYQRTTSGRVAWCYLKNADPTQRPKAYAIICKHGTCDLGMAENTFDAAKIAGPDTGFVDRLNVAVAKILDPYGPFCFRTDPQGNDVVDPWRRDPITGAIVPFVDAQYEAACTEALAVIQKDWPDGPAPPPRPPPPPPPPSGYVVKPSGSSLTRVVYAYISATNKRGANAGTTVAVNSPCDPAIKVTEVVTATLTNVYMGVQGGIAVCVPK